MKTFLILFLLFLPIIASAAEPLEIDYEVKRMQDNTINVQYFPVNIGIEKHVTYGEDYKIETTVAEAIKKNINLTGAKTEILKALDKDFPGAYE